MLISFNLLLIFVLYSSKNFSLLIISFLLIILWFLCKSLHLSQIAQEQLIQIFNSFWSLWLEQFEDNLLIIFSFSFVEFIDSFNVNETITKSIVLFNGMILPINSSSFVNGFPL